jgi:hypothetical protein
LFCKVFRENKKLNLELESVFSKIVSLRFVHDDMSARPYDNCNMIIVNYVDLWLVHFHVASLLDSTRLELRELKPRSTLLGACTSYPLFRSDLEAAAVEIKDLKHRIDHASRYTVLIPSCVVCGSLKGKLFHATKKNIELKQEVAYLTVHHEETILNKKMIEQDLSRVEKSATKCIYKLGIGFKRCEDNGEKNAPKFIPSSNYHQEEKTVKSTKAHHSVNPKPSFKSKREVRKETPKPREEAFVCMFCGCDDQLDKFCFWRKRIERRRFNYARNLYHDEFSDFPPHSFSYALPHTSSHALSHFSHGPNNRSYDFGSVEISFAPKRFGYGPHPHRGDRFPRRPSFPIGGSHTHPELRHLDGSRFPRLGSCPTRSNGELQRTVKIYSGRMVKC